MEEGQPDISTDAPKRTPILGARRRSVAILLGGVLVLAIVVWSSTRSTGPAPLSRADVDRTVKTAVDKAAKDAAAAPARSTLVYQTIEPSLVVIRTDHAGSTDSSLVEDGHEVGLGTGVVIKADGTILTANHVVAGAGSIDVTFADGTRSTAEIVAQVAENDIAVLKPAKTPELVVPAVLGGGARVGDDIYAVGHPLGLLGSMSAGVVSGLNRSIPIKGGSTLDGLIQFDAAVNPGNSGGPLLNRNGQVIGIVTALANPSEQGFFVGIGFAVTIATAGGAAGGPPQ